MATCITFGIQKGGVGKTTTAALSSWLLSRKSRVLAVDMDSQGNLTQVLSRRPPESFAGRTVLEALKKGRPDTYIHRIEESLHLLPADDLLQTFDGSPDTLKGILEGLPFPLRLHNRRSATRPKPVDTQRPGGL